MPSQLIEYRLRIRNAADSADALEITSVPAGTNPYVSGTPSGDGASFNPLTGSVTAGNYSVRVVDPITGGTSRFFTSQLEDAGSRQQLGYRKAFVEFRVDGGAWQNLYAGRLSAYRLVSDIEWEIVVSDWMQAEHEFKVFDKHPADSFAAYLARWPNRGCILGGPIVGGFLGVADRGGWEFKVAASGTGHTMLAMRKGYYPDGWTVGLLPVDLHQLINELASPFFVPRGDSIATPATGSVDTLYGTFPDLAVVIGGVAFTPTNGRNAAVRAAYGQHAYDPEPDHLLQLQGAADGEGTGRIYLDGDQVALGALTLNQIVRVLVISTKVSEASPIYWTGHPVDFLAAVWTEAGFPYSAAALTTVRNTVGASLQITLRLTQSEDMGHLLERAIYGPFGIGVRGNAAGELEAFCMRIFANIPPVVTIGAADVVADSTRAFDLDTSDAIRNVSVEHERILYKHFQMTPEQRRYSQAHGKHMGPATMDSVDTQSERFERTNADAGVVGTGEQAYTIPGMVHFKRTTNINLEQWVDGRAHEIFDRWGRGPISAETILLRGAAGNACKLGDEILVNLPQIPNHNKRLGDDGSIAARAMQIVHLTPLLIGAKVKLLDSGPNAQPVATVPTHTIAAAANMPRNVAELTITNAAALNAASLAVRVQIAITTGGAPATTDYTDVLYFKRGTVPTTAFALPPVLSGSSVYARARAEEFLSRPSNWSTGVGVALAALPAVTSLVATPSADGSRCVLTWAVGDVTALLDVYIRKTAAPASANLLADVLSAGSVGYTLENLEQSTAYTATVQHRNETTGDVSAAVTVGFSTGATVVALTAPIFPDGFSFPIGVPGRLFGRNIVGRFSRYGIAVVATAHPSETEVAEALETGVGTGVYGSYATVGNVTSVSGDWTMWHSFAPNDGLRRKLKARHVYLQMTASAYSAEVIVNPAVHDPIATYPIKPPVASITLASVRNRKEEVLTLDGSLGANDPGPLQWRYKVNNGAWTGYVSTALPTSLTLPRTSYYDQAVVLQLLQNDGQTAIASYSVPARGEDGASRVDEDERRSGMGGVPVRRGRIPVDVQYDDTGFYPMIDTVLRRVTIDLGAADGKGVIESTRAAREKASAAMGHAARGLTAEGRERAGSGGVDTPSGRVNTEPLFDATGLEVLLDTVIKRFAPTMTDSTGAEVRKAFKKGAHTDPDDLTAVPDSAAGSGRKAVTTNEKTGSGRAFNALNSNDRLVNVHRVPMTAVGGPASFQSGSPLSSSNLVVSIAAHSVYFGGSLTVAYNGGSVSVGSAGTWYIYADDPDFNGGAVTYNAAGAKATLSQADGRYYVGQITVVNPGSGTGAQPGAGGVRPL